MDSSTKEQLEEMEKVLNALHLILPLAKGYVAKNQVGSNQRYIEIAEQQAEDLSKKLELWKTLKKTQP